MKRNPIWLLAMGVVIGIWIGHQLFPKIVYPEPEVVERIVEVPVDRIVYKHIPARLEVPMTPTPIEEITGFPVGEDELECDVVTAFSTLDTTLGDHGRLKVTYFLPPTELWNLEFDPAPQKIIYKDVLIPKFNKRPWYRSQMMGFIGGALFTGAVVYMTK